VLTDDGSIWVTVDMEGRVVKHGNVIYLEPPDLSRLPPAEETVEPLPVDRNTLWLIQGQETFRHEGRAFKLDLTGWRDVFITDGPYMGPDGMHVLATFSKPFPGMKGEAGLIVRLFPRPPLGAAPFDSLPRIPQRTTERRIIAMGGLPGTLKVSTLERRELGDVRPRTWYVSAEQAGAAWHLWLELQGTLVDPGPLVQEMTRIAGSLRTVAGMPTPP
jgi:hypothetical protein